MLFFFGAGLPANIRMPVWDALVERIAQELGYDPPRLLSQLGDHMQIVDYFCALKKDQGPLHYILAELYRVPSVSTPGLDWRAYACLRDLDPKLVYTTNFDVSIEEYFSAHGRTPHTVSKIDHLLDAPTGARPIVVHFHGDVLHPHTIVLGERAYLTRLDLESPMDLRLRSDLLSHTVVFLGYSFRDFNVRYIWHKLRRLLAPYSADYGHTYEGYFVTQRENEVFSEIMRSNGLRTVTVPVANVADTIPAFLTGLSEALK